MSHCHIINVAFLEFACRNIELSTNLVLLFLHILVGSKLKPSCIRVQRTLIVRELRSPIGLNVPTVRHHIK